MASAYFCPEIMQDIDDLRFSRPQPDVKNQTLLGGELVTSRLGMEKYLTFFYSVLYYSCLYAVRFVYSA